MLRKAILFHGKKNIVINVQRLIQKMISSMAYNDPGRCLIQISKLAFLESMEVHFQTRNDSKKGLKETKERSLVKRAT